MSAYFEQRQQRAGDCEQTARLIEFAVHRDMELICEHCSPRQSLRAAIIGNGNRLIATDATAKVWYENTGRSRYLETMELVFTEEESPLQMLAQAGFEPTPGPE